MAFAAAGAMDPSIATASHTVRDARLPSLSGRRRRALHAWGAYRLTPARLGSRRCLHTWSRRVGRRLRSSVVHATDPIGLRSVVISPARLNPCGLHAAGLDPRLRGLDLIRTSRFPSAPEELTRYCLGRPWPPDTLRYGRVAVAHASPVDRKIGRASCRERV